MELKESAALPLLSCKQLHNEKGSSGDGASICINSDTEAVANFLASQLGNHVSSGSSLNSESKVFMYCNFTCSSCAVDITLDSRLEMS